MLTSWVGRLIVADIAVRSDSFRVVALYAPNDQEERVDFLRQLDRSWLIRRA